MFELKWFVVIFFISIWIYVLWSRRKLYFLCTKVPGPLGYPLLGIMFQLYKREEILISFNNIEKEYGRTFVAWLGPTPFLIVADPERVEQILTSPQLINKAKVYKPIIEFVGDGLFSCTSTRWKHHRKHISLAFKHKVLISFLPIFNREINKLNKKLNKLIGNGEHNLTEFFQACTINTAAETTMGKPMDNVEEGNTELLHCFQFSLEVMTTKLFRPLKRNKQIFQLTSQYHEYEKTKKTISDFIRTLIEEKVQSIKTDTKSQNFFYEEDECKISKPVNIFIDHAIELVRIGEFTWDDVEAEALTMVFGAFETTANAVNNVLTCLAMFPHYQSKVFAEIIDIFPEEDFEVQYEDLQKLVYLEMVINETMRLISPVPIVARTVINDVILFDNIVLPKGLEVAIDIFNMQRDESIWGPNAKNFCPDHFLPENLANKHPYAFIPFTKGTRMCIGVKYGMMFIKVALAKILRKYHFTTTFKFKDLQFLEDITIKLVEVPKLEVHRRTL